MPSGPERQRRRWRLLLLVAVGLVAVIAVLESRGPAQAPPAPTPPLPRTAAPAPPAAWLGLNYNSGSHTGSLSDFAARGIVYDRLGSLEVDSGQTPETSRSLHAGLQSSLAARMVPDIEVDTTTGASGCSTNPNGSGLCLPTASGDIERYVQGFVATAAGIRTAFPHEQVLFEPTDEPWDWASPPGTQSGRAAAQQYARVLAELLPAARAAGVPLADIYVPALGTLSDGSSWIPDLYAAEPCLRPGPATCGPIEGWNLHPYGLPHERTEGIGSVPIIRTAMLSGQDNIVVSEIGFCADDVGDSSSCQENLSDLEGSSRQTAAWLRETLEEAVPMHRAGWLKALIVWERAGGGGFAMQHPDGALTAQGRILDLFADSPAGR